MQFANELMSVPLFWVCAAFVSSAALLFFMRSFPLDAWQRRFASLSVNLYLLLTTLFVVLWSRNMNNVWVLSYFCSTILLTTGLTMGGIIRRVMFGDPSRIFHRRLRKYRDFRMPILLLVSLIPGLFWTVQFDWSIAFLFICHSMALGASLGFLWLTATWKRRAFLLLGFILLGEVTGIGVTGELREDASKIIKDPSVLLWAAGYFAFRLSVAAVSLWATDKLIRERETEVMAEFEKAKEGSAS